MKNYINYIKSAFFLGLLLTMASCDTEPSVSDVSRITYFPDFAYEGPAESLIPCNSDYEIPPVTASEQGVDLPVATEVLGLLGSVPAVDITKADYYVETSSALNADGFSGSVTREFWVACTGDLVTSIEGLYTCTVFRNGTNSPQYENMKYILIRKIGTDQYEISNADFGWYEYGRNLGRNYASPGATITAVDIPSNTFTFGPPVEVNTFGGPCQLTGLTVDPDTKTVVGTSDWRNGTFLFEGFMTQVPL
jgi:hypothetical protein